ATWSYSEETMCAVRGSTVVFLCLFENTEKREIDRFMWGHTTSSNIRLILRHPGHGSGRYEYIGDKERNCSMKVHKVERYDAGKYFFRFNMNKGCHTKQNPIQTLIDLNVLVQNADGDEIQEGDSVTLTCINSCDGHDASSMLSWFKDGKAIDEGPVLQLNNVSTEHSGNYTCSLKSQNGTTSAVARVVVERADGGVVLICSSEAQPPVGNYSWFRIADGQTLTVGRQAELFAVHAGQYLCSVSNKHGSQNSTVFTLKTKREYFTLGSVFYERVIGECIHRGLFVFFYSVFFETVQKAPRKGQSVPTCMYLMPVKKTKGWNTLNSCLKVNFINPEYNFSYKLEIFYFNCIVRIEVGTSVWKL
uniref:Ig-like domain-containing protein n=1 Tax=Fundulus heteroclitus TaxID=8078 RepID=A0A3Q2QEZ3_FUNHE